MAVMYPDGASLAYKIDHVGVCMPGAEEAFRFCHERLALPVAWLLPTTEPLVPAGSALAISTWSSLTPAFPSWLRTSPRGSGLWPSAGTADG